MQITLEGKVALVSGGGAGIGRAIVDAYHALGASLTVAEIDPLKCEMLEAEFPHALIVQCDVREASQVQALAKKVEARFERLDVLVNNVGHHLGDFQQLDTMSDEAWDAQYHINLRHMFLMCRAMIPLMKRCEGGASIINLSSVEGFRGCPYNVGYTTFKHAVRGFTEALAIQLGSFGIRVNLIAPETTDSEQVPLAQVYRPEFQQEVGRTIPLGRMGRPQDHAGAAVYLATELSSWVTGSSLLVDGGTLPQGPFHRVPSGAWTNSPVVVGNMAQDM